MATVTVAVAVVLAGCARPDEPVPPPVPSPTADDATVVDCANGFTGAPPDTDTQVLLDAVILPTRTVLEATPDPDGGFLAKWPLAVRPGVSVDLRVAPEAAGHARIGWGSPGTPSAHQRVPACTPAVDWLAFSGGYTVDERMCVPLLLRADGREARGSIGVGVACPR